MISPARKLAYKFLSQIESRTIFSDDALNSPAMEQLELRDRNLTTEMVYGTLRWQGLLDYILGGVSSRAWEDVDPGARVLLRISVYQMWQMDRIPDHALVNDAVELAKKELGKGIDKYLNGILRHLARMRPWARRDFFRKTPPWIRASLPQWLWDRWAGRFGETAAMEYALSLNRPPQAAMRLSPEAAGTLPFEAVPSTLVPDAAIRISAPAEKDRNLHYQDEASQLIPHLFGPLSGCRVWDACAAPGGKTAILCGLCGESGRVIASDVGRDRISRLQALSANLGRLNPELLVADVSQPSPFLRFFDAILADVPCSGLGTLRRNPEIKWHFKPESFAALQKTQKEILDSVSESVRIGGRLLYSTCSTEPEENEQVIEWFLRNHPGFILEKPPSPPGIERWTGDDKLVRTFPGTHLWDGFFGALIIRLN